MDITKVCCHSKTTNHFYCDYEIHSPQNGGCFLILDHFNCSKSKMARCVNGTTQFVDKHDVYSKCHSSIACQNINWQGVLLTNYGLLEIPSGCFPFRGLMSVQNISSAASTS
jgi:hypothetical protein